MLWAGGMSRADLTVTSLSESTSKTYSQVGKYIVATRPALISSSAAEAQGLVYRLAARLICTFWCH